MKALTFSALLLTLPFWTQEAKAPVSHSSAILSKPWFGIASWYGEHWRGHLTACGQRFNPDSMTVAHPYLKCGTVLRVTSVRTGRSGYVRVADRGPFMEGREIDLSEHVAQKLGIRQSGISKVKIEVVK